jgi:hypothetical protein
MLALEQRRQQKRLSRQKRLAKTVEVNHEFPTVTKSVEIKAKKPTGKTCKQYGWMLCQPNGAPVLWADTYDRCAYMLKMITANRDGFQIVRATMTAEYDDGTD